MRNSASDISLVLFKLAIGSLPVSSMLTVLESSTACTLLKSSVIASTLALLASLASDCVTDWSDLIEASFNKIAYAIASTIAVSVSACSEYSVI